MWVAYLRTDNTYMASWNPSPSCGIQGEQHVIGKNRFLQVAWQINNLNLYIYKLGAWGSVAVKALRY